LAATSAILRFSRTRQCFRRAPRAMLDE
jgi:hypothetical protein